MARPRSVREDEEDFGAFWAQQQANQEPEYKQIYGVRVAVPTDIPLSFEDTLEELSTSTDKADLERALSILFGADVLGTWKANGMTTTQLRVLMAWGMRNAYGKPTTFAEAIEFVRQAEADEAVGKAKAVPINRAARRGSSKTGASGAGGRSSSRTSAVNTGSRRSS